MGEYDNYSIKRLPLTLNWLRKPLFIHVSIYSHWMQGRQKTQKSFINRMTYLDTSLNDAPTEGNKWWPLSVQSNTLFFFSQIYSDVVKIHLFEPICIVKDLLRERGEFSKFSQKACMDSLSFRSISIQAKRSISKIIYLGDKSMKEALKMIVNFKLKLYMQINVLLTGKIWGYGKNMKVRWIGAFSWYVPSFIRSK